MFFLQAISAGAIRDVFFKLFLSHQVGQKYSKEKNYVIGDFQTVVLMLTLNLSEKFTKYTRPSIKLSTQRFPYSDPMGIYDNIEKFL